MKTETLSLSGATHNLTNPGTEVEQNAPSTLLDRLPEWLEADNGIPKLRELILQLAVQGKLVPQDLNDEPASELLKAT